MSVLGAWLGFMMGMIITLSAVFFTDDIVNKDIEVLDWILSVALAGAILVGLLPTFGLLWDRATPSRKTHLQEGSGEVEPGEATELASDPAPVIDDGDSERQRSKNLRVALAATAAGLLCLFVGILGVIDSGWFTIWGKPVTATVVEVRRLDDGFASTLEFAVAGRRYRTEARGVFGVIWAEYLSLGSHVSVLYAPDDPDNTRLAAFAPRFAIPLC